ncbi:hypothetical protein HMI49_08955 [Corallococcus exercitus]|uniref:Uncharacterized protein n=1 Tax=Corallococcus exercitus TaxID=2316736 RepID=A0A7Y4NRV9_9BACT|nr:hypothetical protein [Corallococcus exercitus]NOK33322.1 hypothetical protein [Corallococcus exercitus]
MHFTNDLYRRERGGSCAAANDGSCFVNPRGQLEPMASEDQAEGVVADLDLDMIKEVGR